MSVLRSDGLVVGVEDCDLFVQGGRPEVWLVVELDDWESRMGLCLRVSFASLEKGEEAAGILRDALARVETLRVEEAPPVDDGHEHRPRPFQFSGSLMAVCEICNADLGELPRRPGG